MKPDAPTTFVYRSHMYKVTTPAGGSLLVPVEVRDIELSGEHAAVAHAAWRELWKNEKDKWGNETKKVSATARVLKKLCDMQGVDVVKEAFTAGITFEKEF